MSIPTIPTKVPILALSPSDTTSISGAQPGKPSTPFAQVKDRLADPTSMMLPKQITALEQKVLAGKSVSSAELLTAQVAMHRFNLKVELVAKGVESTTSAVKRLQQQQ